MAKKKYHIVLSEEQKDMLNKILEDGIESERTCMRAKILLESDEVTGSKLSVPKLAKLLNTTSTTIQTTRTEYANGDLEASLYRKKRTIKPVKHRISSVMEAEIIKLAKTQPPVGSKRWTYLLLKEESIKRGIVDQISETTLRNMMRKNNIKLN